tara:strand:+ start:6043 stop:6885 length:843 start_codon:yes stop_codon:yes gene_type:complete
MIIWLASYPKSGNTLVRSLLSGYFFSKEGEFNFDLLRRIDQFPNKKLFDELKIDLSNRDEVEKNYIEAQKIINKDEKSLQFWKTHNAFCKLQGKYNFTDLQNTTGVIYIVRDPRNVVSSYSNHYQKTIDQSVKDLNENLEIRQSINDKLPVLIGSWKFHYNSWKQLKSLNKYLLVKYEDLLSDTEKTFLNILEFIKEVSGAQIEIDRDKIHKVINNTSFSNIKKLEDKFGFKEAKKDKNGKIINFFNLGPKNNWKNSLSNETIKKVETYFADEMKEIGYL